MNNKLTALFDRIRDTIGHKHFACLDLVNEIEDITSNQTENKYIRIHSLLNRCFPLLEKQNEIDLAIDAYAMMQELKKKF